MSRPRASGLAHSVQARLKNVAQARGRPFAELLELYAIERFLHRLGRSPHRDKFVLKGALLLRHWLGAETRPTRDIDLLGPLGLEEGTLRELLGDLLRLAVEDDASSSTSTRLPSDRSAASRPSWGSEPSSMRT